MSKAPAASVPSRGNPVGELILRWRTLRRTSQLQLALNAGLSARHLSFIETGKARPSRDALIRLAEALSIPLRERNALLTAGKFAAEFRETGFTAPELARARHAVDLLLKQQEPYPAIVLDRHWNLVRLNRGAERFVLFLLGKPPAEANVVRQIFSDQLLRPWIVNWPEVAADIMARLHREIDWAPTDDFLPKLRAEVLGYPGVPQALAARGADTHVNPMLNFTVAKDGITLRFFSTWTTFGAPQDVTLEELRIESSFPADDATVKAWRRLSRG